MGRGILLWLLGVPIPVIILLWLFFGHLAYEVDDIYATCEKLQKAGVTINRPPRDGNMAFVRSPDLHSIELLQKGEPKPPAEPWTSMPNTGHW